MRNYDESFMNYQTITFPYGNFGYMIDVVDMGEEVEYWLYQDDGGRKMFMYGEDKVPGTGQFSLDEDLDYRSRVIELQKFVDENIDMAFFMSLYRLEQDVLEDYHMNHA